MSILPSSTSSTSSLPQIETPDLITVEFNAQIPWKASDRILEEAIGKLINLDEIVDRLQALDCQQSAAFTTEQVKFAFLKWIENHLESIELQPEWFIHQDFKHFERYLPELDGSFFPEEEYDQGVMYEDRVAHDTAQFQLDSQLAAVNLAAELTATDYPSPLEDAFDGTPEQAAIAALDW
ncbi:hypothetical protein QUA54_18705 [Microcoleus sp. MOSTC5]|uniref:hypothetical protein n=1 Tax=Microcoleus sp. MOSTC5 TaxID=3055378 RepID=UPI002FCEEAF7